jgi:hypothetical protein
MNDFPLARLRGPDSAGMYNRLFQPETQEKIAEKSSA